MCWLSMLYRKKDSRVKPPASKEGTVTAEAEKMCVYAGIRTQDRSFLRQAFHFYAHTTANRMVYYFSDITDLE